jgi:hypothetical protein
MRDLEAMEADPFRGDMKRLVPAGGAGVSESSAFFTICIWMNGSSS